MWHTHPEAANAEALPSEFESSLDDDDASRASSMRCCGAHSTLKCQCRVDDSDPLALSLPQGLPQTVDETAIPHQEVEWEGQSQDHGL